MKNLAKEIEVGTVIEFTPTHSQFVIAKVTDKRISWNTVAHTSSWGKNTMRMAWASMRQFQKGLDEGIYKVVEEYAGQKENKL
jgi:hypothetical protein